MGTSIPADKIRSGEISFPTGKFTYVILLADGRECIITTSRKQTMGLLDDGTAGYTYHGGAQLIVGTKDTPEDPATRAHLVEMFDIGFTVAELYATQDPGELNLDPANVRVAYNGLGQRNARQVNRGSAHISFALPPKGVKLVSQVYRPEEFGRS